MKIPRNIEEATEALTGIESLLTKKGWERAAIVAAFVRLTGSGSNRNTEVYGPEKFAALGIQGLASGNTVRTYVQAWLDAHDSIYPEPGAEVEVPTDPWPPTGKPGIHWGQMAGQPAEKIVEKLTPTQRVEVVREVIKTTPAEDIVEVIPDEKLDDVEREVVKRVEVERDLDLMRRGAKPVDLSKFTAPKRSALDSLADTAEARVRVESALTEVIAAIKAFGSVGSDDPLSDRIKTTAMEMVDAIVYVEGGVR